MEKKRKLPFTLELRRPARQEMAKRLQQARGMAQEGMAAKNLLRPASPKGTIFKKPLVPTPKDLKILKRPRGPG